MLRRYARLAIQQGQAHGRSGRGSGAHRRNVYTTPKTHTNQDDADAGLWRHGSIQHATLDEDDKIRKEVIIMKRKTNRRKGIFGKTEMVWKTPKEKRKAKDFWQHERLKAGIK
jgi:hypothetical protein